MSAATIYIYIFSNFLSSRIIFSHKVKLFPIFDASSVLLFKNYVPHHIEGRWWNVLKFQVVSCFTFSLCTGAIVEVFFFLELSKNLNYLWRIKFSFFLIKFEAQSHPLSISSHNFPGVFVQFSTRVDRVREGGDPINFN